MLSSSLSNYKKNYDDRLSTYRNDYEDNTETSFLEIEFNAYAKCYDALTSMAKLFQNRTTKEMKHTHIYASRVLELKNIDENIYYDIVTELKNDEEEIHFDRYLTLEEIMKELIEINFEKLENRIASAKRILEFINDKKMHIKKSLAPEKKTESKISNISIETIPDKPLKSIPAKWYALQYLLELRAKGLKPPVNTEGAFIKCELEKIGEKRTGLSGQGFYRAVLKYSKDLNNPELLIKSLGKDWMNTINLLSADNNDLKDYLKENY